MLGSGGPLHEIPGGIQVLGELGHGQRPDPDVRRRTLGIRVGRERRVGQLAGHGVVAAVHEVAENVGVEDHARLAGPKIRADLVPGMGRPVACAAVLDHLDPLGVEGLRSVGVHGGGKLAVVVGQVHFAEVGVGRQEAGVDGCPGARAAHAVVSGLNLGGGLDEFVHIGRDGNARLVEHRLVVGEVVLLVAPGDAPLLGVVGAELAARDAVPGAGLAHAFQHVGPIVVRIGLFRVVQPFVVIDDPAGRSVGPGHVGAGHEGVVFRGSGGQGRRDLVEIDIFREDVVGDVHAGQLLERVQIGNHGIRVGMLVQKQLDAFAGMFLPVEIRRQSAGRHHVVQCSGRSRREPQGPKPPDQAASAHSTVQKRGNQILFLFVHGLSSQKALT